MATALKNGEQVDDPRLGRVKQFDEKSRGFPVILSPEIPAEKRPRSYTWRCQVRLNQGNRGTCVGHSRALCNAARPVENPQTDADALKIFDRAQELDPWEGKWPQYDGTSVLAGVQAAQELGYVKDYWWSFTLEEFILAQGYVRPAVVGIDWTEDMFHPDSNGFIHSTGAVAGGHAILVMAIKIVRATSTTKNSLVIGGVVIDLDKSYITFLNSWGPGWGNNGTAKMTLFEFDPLRRNGGEAVFANEIKKAA